MRKGFFLALAVIVATLLVGFEQAQGAEDLVLAVDKSTLVKILGLAGLALLGEVWRNQRALFKITTGLGKEVREIKGFCKGKNGDCDFSDGESGD